MKKAVMFFVIILLCGIAAFVAQREKQSATPVVKLRNAVFAVEIADTPEERARGLGGREELCATCGMLFLFEKSGRHGFWMKDMHFPLDILWLHDSVVVYIEHAVSHEDQTTTYVPTQAGEMVLEVPAGTAAREGIVVGDRAHIDL